MEHTKQNEGTSIEVITVKNTLFMKTLQKKNNCIFVVELFFAKFFTFALVV